MTELNQPIKPFFSKPRGKHRIEGQLTQLIKDFSVYLDYFDAHNPFDKSEHHKSQQLYYHLMTSRRRQKLNSAHDAAMDCQFLQNLYVTLQHWGIGKRDSRLKSFEVFAETIASRADEIGQLDGIDIGDPSQESQQVAAQVWTLIEFLEIVDNTTLVISGTKTLHHLLPNLVVPMDNVYTKPFFKGDYNYLRGRQTFYETFREFWRIAGDRTTAVKSYVVGLDKESWRTSQTKIIDNAIIGYCIKERLA